MEKTIKAFVAYLAANGVILALGPDDLTALSDLETDQVVAEYCRRQGETVTDGPPAGLLP